MVGANCMFRAQELKLNIKNKKEIVLSDTTMHIALIFWHLALLSVFLRCLFKLWTLDQKRSNPVVVCSALAYVYIVTT